MTVERLSAERSRYPNRSPDCSSMLPLPKPRVTVNLPPPSLWWGRFDFFVRIVAWKKRSLKCTKGGEHHVEFVLAEPAPDYQRRLRDCAEKGRISAIKRGKKEARAGRVRYDATACQWVSGTQLRGEECARVG